MTRFFLFVLAIGLVVAALGMVYLGAFPPRPVQHHVETVLPLDRIPPKTAGK